LRLRGALYARLELLVLDLDLPLLLDVEDLHLLDLDRLLRLELLKVVREVALGLPLVDRGRVVGTLHLVAALRSRRGRLADVSRILALLMGLRALDHALPIGVRLADLGVLLHFRALGSASC